VSRAAQWILVICLLAGPSVAEGEIYGWHDAQGVAHYVSDLENVPPEYQARVVTVVKDLPLPPPASPLEPAVPSNAVPPAAQAVATDHMMMMTAFERGYRAGLDQVAAPDPGPSVGSIVQNVQIIESPPVFPAFVSPSPFFGPVLGSPGIPHKRRAFFPQRGGRFIQGPAGPPPLGAPGPPPVTFSRR
jgi:hypothetical protein